MALIDNECYSEKKNKYIIDKNLKEKITLRDKTQ